MLDLSISDKGVLKSPSTIVDLFITPNHSINFCLVYLHVVLIGTYILKITVFVEN